jgi:hypothetical protein
MYCCIHCFSDKFLNDYITNKSQITDNCSFCGSNGLVVIEPELLTDTFQILFDLYKTSTDVKALPLHEQIQKDWSLFADSISLAKRREILENICCGRISLDDKYAPRIEQVLDRITQWNEFREELKHINRYFPEKLPERDALVMLLSSLIISDDEVPQEIFRARINKKGNKFSKNEMGRPPNEKALNGRANPLGISYLYAASDTSTAISEVQPYKGETVTVVKIKINDIKTLADLRNPRKTVSPFELDEDGLVSLYKEIPYLVTLGEELSKPIVPFEADLEYLSSQYLCELIKSNGYSGVLYKSSLGNGYNIALFDEIDIEFVELKEYKILDNNIQFEEIH